VRLFHRYLFSDALIRKERNCHANGSDRESDELPFSFGGSNGSNASGMVDRQGSWWRNRTPRPWQKIVFMGGLFGAVVFLLIAGLFWR
jgi:hypothetical protein